MKPPLVVLILLCLVLVATVSAAAAPAKKQAEECSWGASSVVVEDVNGQLVQSEPRISGCIP
jgi:hypothetical protein